MPGYPWITRRHSSGTADAPSEHRAPVRQSLRPCGVPSDADVRRQRVAQVPGRVVAFPLLEGSRRCGPGLGDSGLGIEFVPVRQAGHLRGSIDERGTVVQLGERDHTGAYDMREALPGCRRSTRRFEVAQPAADHGRVGITFPAGSELVTGAEGVAGSGGQDDAQGAIQLFVGQRGGGLSPSNSSNRVVAASRVQSCAPLAIRPSDMGSP